MKYIDADKLKELLKERQEEKDYREVIWLIDSLQQEQSMEDLEDEYVRFVRTDHHQHQFLLGKAGIDIARHFAEWGAKQVKSDD